MPQHGWVKTPILTFLMKILNQITKLQNYKLQNYKITNYKLQITSYKLQITNYKLQITSYQVLKICFD